MGGDFHGGSQAQKQAWAAGCRLAEHLRSVAMVPIKPKSLGTRNLDEFSLLFPFREAESRGKPQNKELYIKGER